MKKYFLTSLLAVFLPVLVFAGSEVHITKDGLATLTVVKVMQQAGTTFYTRLYWGDSFVRMILKTNSRTKYYRATGEATTINEISEGNSLDVTGELESGTNGLSLIAFTIRNSSVQKEWSTFSGKVSNVDLNVRSLILQTKANGDITVLTSTTTVFTKGSRTLDLEHVKVGDNITKVSGDYDLSTKILVATNINTFVDQNYYKPKLFEGKLVEVTSTTTPISIKVSLSGVVYTINISDKTVVLNKARNNVSLSRFVAGDNIRIYGAIREVDEPIIDVEVVRNTNL